MERPSIPLLVLAVLLPLACSKPSDNPTPPALSAVPAATSAAPAATSAAVTASATAAAKPEPPVYKPRKVPGGMLSGMWVQPFEIVRDKGNLGLSYLDAMRRCMGYDKVLCNDAEWVRACETDAELAKIETWTASGMGSNKFVVRGGDVESGCRARDIKEGTDLSPTRAAVCCDPNIAIKATSKQDEQLTAVMKDLFAYQRAMRTQDTLALTGLYGEKITFLGKDHSNTDIIKIHTESFKKDPEQWTIFDTCTVGVDPGTDDGGANAKATADCRTLFQRGGSVIVAMQRLMWTGSPMKITLIGDAVTSRQPQPDGTVVEEKELKERVGILLSAD